MGSGSENPPHSPAQTPGSTTLPSLKEMRAILRERFGISEGESDKVLGFKVSPETYVSYHTLGREDKGFVKEVVETVVAGLRLGYIERGASPHVVLKRKVAPATITIEEVERSELEERLKSYEKLVEELRKENKVLRELVNRYEDAIETLSKELEELRGRCDPELAQKLELKDRQLSKARELLRAPLGRDFCRNPALQSRYRDEVTAFLNSLAGQG